MRWSLLIFMTAIAGIVMYAGAHSLSGSAVGELCERAEISIDHKGQTCYKGNTVYFNAENSGTTELEGVKIYLEADYNISISIEDKVLPGGPIKKRLDFGAQGIEGFKEITLRPIIKEGNIEQVCREKKVRVELEEC